MKNAMDKTFGYNTKFLTKDGKPWFPIMGEFHFSRFNEKYWKESLYKMKAGGVEVVSTYVIWIHHEEIEGEYDFSGQRNLREFIRLCGECGLYLFLRIGPWCHGEVRNGGFPDWLLKKEYTARTNEKGYLDGVHKFYTKIYEQINGMLLKDNGPIIGVQIENEYGHCGGLSGEEGEKHMHTLIDFAKEIGFDVPYWTATGWGGAVTGGLIPVMGGYCEAPWDQRITEIEPSVNYLFSIERNDHNIGSDLGVGSGLTFDMEKFPYLTAELGGGLQVTHHRRPIARAEDTGAMSLVKLGSGVNLLGYYVYHGGTNPKGKLSTLQESRETGYLNDLPVLSYDFRAPIREYGQLSDTFMELKLFTMFLRDFGSELCEMPAYIPSDAVKSASDLHSLRVSYRHNGSSGYVFVNNYQRKRQMASHKSVVLSVDLKNETVSFPPIDIENGEYYFYPVNMKLGDATLKTAVATPLCKLENGNETTYVFYTDKIASYDIDKELINTKILTLSRTDAKKAYKINNHLIISDSGVIETDTGISILGGNNARLLVYPALLKTPEGFTQLDDVDDFACYENVCAPLEGNVSFILKDADDKQKIYEIEISTEKGANDWFLELFYLGDCARIYVDDELCADNFYTGEPWEISLKHLNFPHKIRMEIDALYADAPIYLEEFPKMSEGKVCELKKASLNAEYQINTYLI